MSIDPQRAQTLSAISTVLSAFMVFVIGGGVVLKIWVDERKGAQRSPADEVVATEEAKPAPEPVVEPGTKKLQSKKTIKPKIAKVRASERPAVKKAKSTKAAKVAKAVSASSGAVGAVSGKGQVVVAAGDASRVRLIGSNGTFGSGTVPAGSYTIQATFRDGDPRMAGTVQVADGQRIIIVCKAAGQRCVQR